VKFALTEHTIEGALKQVGSGYRPLYDVRPDYWSSAHHEFINTDRVTTGEQSLAEVWLLSPEAYPQTFWIVRQLNVAGGSRVIGTVEVLQILNPSLRMD
jgi:hypothetical protein